jgi:transposase-like protein
MLKQRDLFLKQQKQQNSKNKANGFYEKELAYLFGLLNLNVHKDRELLFHPSILPDKWKN